MPDAKRIASADRTNPVATKAEPPHPPAGPATSKSSKGENIQVSPAVVQAARMTGDELLLKLHTVPGGLTQVAAEERARTVGPNEVAQEKPQTWPIRLLKIIRNPLVILLTTLSGISFATGDARAGSVMAMMVVLSVSLRFLQEARADAAAAKLRAMIHVTATVVRDGMPKEIPLHDLVPGDIIHLSAGDMIPGDVRLLSSKDLFVSQGSLTGESLPVEKLHDVETKAVTSATELKNICFMGTSVQSGTATAVVVTTGVQTYFGSMARSITGERVQTSFDLGLNRFTWLMIRIMAVMVPLVFLINGFTKHDWKGAFFFALAVAVGLTPEMLPMIVSVCLSKGALAMSRRKVIVKRLNSIQNFGAMDVLCTDKTGTLTEDRVVLMRHCDLTGRESENVLLNGYLISHFQTGLKNLLDRAILESPDFHGIATIEKYKKLDEIPFDFTRRMMSVFVEDPEGKRILLTKGAPGGSLPPRLVLRTGREIVADGTFSDYGAERGVRKPKRGWLSRSGAGNEGSCGHKHLYQGGRARPRTERLRRVPGPAEAQCCDRTRGAPPARRSGQDFDWRQSTHQPQGLQRCRPGS